MNGYTQYHQMCQPLSNRHQEYNGGYGGIISPGEMESSRHNRNGLYNKERGCSEGNNVMQYNGNNKSNGNYSTTHSQSNNYNYQLNDGPIPMQQPYHGGDAPSTFCSNLVVPHQFHHIDGVAHTSISTPFDHELTRPISYGESDKSESSKEGKKANTNKESSHHSNMKSYEKRKRHLDNFFVAPKTSFGQLNQVVSIKEDNEKEKDQQMNSNYRVDKLMNKNNNLSFSINLTSDTSTFSSSARRNKSKSKNEPPTSKLASSNDSSLVESIQEQLNTSNYKDDGSVTNIDFSGVPDLINYKSGMLLFHQQDKSLTIKHMEGRGDTETGNREGGKEDIHGWSAPPHHFDSYGKPQNQSSAAPMRRLRSTAKDRFPSRALSRSTSSSTHEGQHQNQLLDNSDQSELRQHLDQSHPPDSVGTGDYPLVLNSPTIYPAGLVSPASHVPSVPHGPYHASHSESFDDLASYSEGFPPALTPRHCKLYDGNGRIENYSECSGHSSLPGQCHHAFRSSSFGGKLPHRHYSDLHLPKAFQPPPPPEFTGNPHLNRRSAPTVYIVPSPLGKRASTHISQPHDPRWNRKGHSDVDSWSKEDDLRLIETIGGGKNPRDWETIAKECGQGKISKECHERWSRFLKPCVRKGQWEDYEDAIIVEAVTASIDKPFSSWFALAHRLPGRVGKQIRNRWVNHLNPINNRPFSREEDLILWEAHKKLGKRWVQIKRKYFGSSRSENNIKNRWYGAFFKKFIANEFGPDAYSGGQRETKRRKYRKS